MLAAPSNDEFIQEREKDPSDNQKDFKSKKSGLVLRIYGINPHSSHELANNSKQPVLISPYFLSVIWCHSDCPFSSHKHLSRDSHKCLHVSDVSKLWNSPKANITIFKFSPRQFYFSSLGILFNVHICLFQSQSPLLTDLD